MGLDSESQDSDIRIGRCIESFPAFTPNSPFFIFSSNASGGSSLGLSNCCNTTISTIVPRLVYGVHEGKYRKGHFLLVILSTRGLYLGKSTISFPPTQQGRGVLTRPPDAIKAEAKISFLTLQWHTVPGSAARSSPCRLLREAISFSCVGFHHVHALRGR